MTRKKRESWPKLLDPLPRRVRLRLWLTGCRDAVAIWLVYRNPLRAAEWTWRLTGGWR
jgi:hypothetical protein